MIMVSRRRGDGWQGDEHDGDVGAVAGALRGFCVPRYVRSWGTRVRIDVPTHTYITALVCIIASLQGDSRLLAF